MLNTSPLIEAVHSFVESLPAEKGYSVHTCRAYTRDLDEFAGYLKENVTTFAPLMEDGVAVEFHRAFHGQLRVHDQHRRRLSPVFEPERDRSGGQGLDRAGNRLEW